MREVLAPSSPTTCCATLQLHHNKCEHLLAIGMGLGKPKCCQFGNDSAGMPSLKHRSPGLLFCWSAVGLVLDTSGCCVGGMRHSARF